MANGRAGGVAVGSAVLLATSALTATSEGFASRPYWDPAHIRTYCFGETTHVQERRYSQGECEILLEQRMARDYAPAIERCAPAIVNDRRVKIFAALLDASYNAGTGAVCSSPMVARIRASDLAGGCAAFEGWRDTATYRGPREPAQAMLAHGWTWNGSRWRKRLPGLVTRRRREAQLCMEGAFS